ncbi:MAG: hypothetical protein A2729_01035 [Candidatus Buchananbacteria bacterium RIFCSPHIGHO2_01_FULL_39_14]|uniref:Solute-binding protein family 5 domain-containing protein n=2 Tax=Candidatus Buchananiibacteriota TaxID=1817903 RepID=A0A1G1YU90_9BACT|nr:MAG: hypothetical protein A2729_01035 [Candidatus Buchananbacteria bacterium RIFCSPHIGHO2_01_FULL_39_14]OGY49700.1 MAG: hypothetical protein A3D39_05495 [Candidatus Buchananbacteria bacterium RIFCSPHIGHO2_02_FULL_39_17]OGY55925.1 MAG: hypothetical protein A2912_02985 [Candidatus Buchananbacteria bacterium RIFCSPLOWO2_01_FULL_40_23b]
MPNPIKKIYSKFGLNKTSNGDAPPTDFEQQKEFDKKLVYTLNSKKIPSIKQLKHLSKILNPQEKKLVGLLLVLIIGAAIFIGATFYRQNFLPVPIAGGDYTGGLVGAPQYINPLLAQTNDVDTDLARLIFSGLLKYNNELEVVPDLAENFQVSEDQKTYTFVLRENLKWHDGEPLTINDVIFTFQSIKDPDFKSPLLISLRGVEIQKIDERTIKFILAEPYPSFLEVLTVGILPEHIWAEIPALNANLTEYNLKPIGSGGWEFKSLIKDRLGNVKSYTLVPNPDFYDKKPYLQKITFKFYPDFSTAVDALKNHSVEGISFLPKDLKSQLTNKKSLNFYSFYLPQYTAIFFNQKNNELLKDKIIRQALALSIDKTKILSEALQLEGEIIDGPIMPVIVQPSTDKKINFNQGQADKILDEAGWQKITPEQYQEFIQKQKEKNANHQGATTTASVATTTENQITQGFLRQKDEKILELSLTTINQPENIKATELIKKFWEDIGIKVNLEIVEGNKIGRQIIKPRNYQALLFGIIVGSNPDPFPFWHSSQTDDPGLNLASFANRDADKILEDVRKITDEEKKKESYQRFLDLLTTELPAIFLYNPTYTYVVDKKIKGINIDRVIIPADRFNNLSEWYLKTKRRWQGGK